MPPPRGPVWTTRLFRQLLAIATDQVPDQLDAATAAAVLEVTPRTVRGWLGEGEPDQPTQCPPRRLARLLALVQPRPGVLADEATKARYAAQVTERLDQPRPQVAGLDIWRRQRWIEPHMFAIVAMPEWGLHRPVVARASDTARRLRGVVDQTLCPHKFAAEVVRGAVLEHLAAWRVVAPASVTAPGRTGTWLSEAPAPALPYSWPADVDHEPTAPS